MGGVGGGWDGWLVGEQRGEKGMCMGEEGSRGCWGRWGVLSNLGVHFRVWKTVGLFQLECNISNEHAPTSWQSELRLEGEHCQWSHFSIHPPLESQVLNQGSGTESYKNSSMDANTTRTENANLLDSVLHATPIQTSSYSHSTLLMFSLRKRLEIPVCLQTQLSCSGGINLQLFYWFIV